MCPPGSDCLALANERRGTPVYGQVTTVGNNLIFTPTALLHGGGLEEGTWHTVVVAGVEDAFNVPMTGVYTWTFETVHIPPVVSEAYPTSSCVPSTTHPWVGFSEEVQRASPLDFDLVWALTLPVSGTSGYFDSGPRIPPAGYPLANSAVFTPAAGLEDGDYAASVAGPMDEYDNVLIPYSWEFHADSTPPHVEETVPAAGATDGYPDEPVVAWLDEPFPSLPPESLQIRDENNVLVTGNLSAVRREGVGFEPPPTGIEFTPLGGEFAAPAVYTATVGTVADYCEHPVVAYTWTFTMACLFVDEGWDPTVEVAACDGQQFALETGQSELAAEYEWQVILDGGAPETTVTQGVSFVMDMPLPDQVATVRVRGRDEQGCITHWSEPTDVSWEVCYPGAPTVTGVAPADGSDGVGIQPSLVVTYNEAVYIGSPGGGSGTPWVPPHASLSLPPSVGDLSFRAEAVVPVTDVWALAVRYVPLWSPSIPSIEEWTAYTAMVAGAMDAAAQAVTATWTFTTGDFTQPEVVGTVPEKESQEGAPEEVVAYFSEDVSTAEAWFTLVGPKGELEGQLAYYSDAPCEPEGPSCFHWHFIPSDPLDSGQYTAEVFGVTDRAGLEMEAPYDWSFEVTEEIGGELLAPPAGAPRVAEPVEREPEEELPAAGAGDAKAAAMEEPLEAPAGDGGEIESGTPGVLYVRKTSYYYFGGQRVAMRQVSTWNENVVYYIVADHLGTTSLVLCGNVSGCDGVPNGGRVAESRHYPYGAERWIWTADGSGALPTDYRFTGQKDVGLGLVHMGARFYDSLLARWLSADTFVPEPGKPQALNRFSYVLGNPLKYIDPTGHKEDGECGLNDEQCQDDDPPPPIDEVIIKILQGMVDVIYDPARMEPIQVTLPDGTLLVIMPVSSIPDKEGAEVFTGIGLGMDLLELASLWAPGSSDLAATVDFLATLGGSIWSGESFIGEAHPSLPPVAVVGQDVLITGGDLLVAAEAKVGGAALGGPGGYSLGVLVDFGTTSLSAAHDYFRLEGSLGSFIKAGVTLDGNFTQTILLYPGSAPEFLRPR